MEKKKKRKIILWISILAVLIIAALILFLAKGSKKPLMINTDRVTTDSIQITVTATGEIQPVYQVTVGTQVSGKVEKLYVDFNSTVEKGQLLAELDRSTLLEQVNMAQANLSDAESNLTLAKQNYDRIKQLYENKAATQEAFEQATNSYIQAKNKVTTSKSNLQNAQVNLSYSQIYSPISGVVLNKEVEEGQTVAASFNTPTLFTIANDLTQMQVEANVDEADIGQVKEGQSVTFTVDAFPDDQFSGTVKQVRLEPIVTSNVVTYTVIIDAPNPDQKLFPGMTASVSIIVNNEKGNAVPMEALYFTMSEQYMKQLSEQGFTLNAASQQEMQASLKSLSKKLVWVKNGNTLTQKSVEVGINDGAKALITKGLQNNEEIVLSVLEPMIMNEATGSSPFKMGPPERKKR